MLDILPTAEYWDMLSPRFGIAIYHWMFLAQPAPFPERLIGGEPRYFCDHSLASWTKDNDLGAFDPTALDDYRAMFDDPARIAAMCADYRAGATFDLALDRDDRAAGPADPAAAARPVRPAGHRPDARPQRRLAPLGRRRHRRARAERALRRRGEPGADDGRAGRLPGPLTRMTLGVP